jgi:hypothetical protein
MNIAEVRPVRQLSSQISNATKLFEESESANVALSTKYKGEDAMTATSRPHDQNMENSNLV